MQNTSCILYILCNLSSNSGKVAHHLIIHLVKKHEEDEEGILGSWQVAYLKQQNLTGSPH